MFTRNFDQLLISYLIGYSSSSYAKILTEFGDDKLSYKISNGDQYPVTTYPSTWFNCIVKTNDPNLISANYCSLILGSGNTAESYDDYEIAYLSNITVETATMNNGIANNIPFVNINRIVRNSGSSTVTINEVGIYACFPARVGTSSLTPIRSMIFRKVLETPVSLEPNKVAEINLRLEFQRLNKPNVSVVINGG